MTTRHIGTVAAVFVLAAVLVPAGTALPAQASPHAERHADERADTAPADTRAPSATPDRQADAHAEPDRAMRGPPTSMPAQAPAFVSDIHRAITAFLAGEIDVQAMTARITAATPGNATAAE